jgi:micrococcal nuclease
MIMASPAACTAAQGDAARTSGCVVAVVVDGDTFRCRDGRRVRLVGIDSPEHDQAPFGGQARTALAQLVSPGAEVRLELDAAPRDQYGRVLAYVWAEGRLVNETMVHDGWAVLYTVPPNVKYAARLRKAQKEARAAGAGLWSQHGFECLPNDFRRRRCVSRP